MDASLIKAELRQIIAEVIKYEDAPENIPDTPDLLQQLLIDSLMALQIIVLIERKFGIFIDDDDVALEILNSLDQATDYIKQNLQSQSSSL